MNSKERNNSYFDTTLFNEMMKRIKKVDWRGVSGVDDMINYYGWEYEYREGMIDKTEFYTRCEEDCIRFKKDGRASIQINLTTGTLVIQDLHDESCYGAPTVFLSAGELVALWDINELILELKRDARFCIDNKDVL